MRDILIAVFITLGLSATLATSLSDAVWADTLFCTITDPKTNMTCDELSANPMQDVYFIVSSTYGGNENVFEEAIQDYSNVRWNVDHTKFIVKYNAVDVPRNQVDSPNCDPCTKPLKNPKNNAEMREILGTTAEWQYGDFIADGKNKDGTEYVQDNNYVEEPQ